MVYSLKTKFYIVLVIILISNIIITLFLSYYIMTDYTSIIKSRSLAIAKNLKFQLDKIMELEIPFDDLIGFEKQCQNIINQYEGTKHAMVVDVNGKIIFHNDKSLNNTNIKDDDLLELIKNSSKGEKFILIGNTYEAILPIFDKDNKHVASIIVGYSKQFAHHPINNLIKSFLILSGILSIIFGLAIYIILTIYVTKPVANLINSINHIKKLGFVTKERVHTNSKDEIGYLSICYNQMIDKLYHTTITKDYLNNILNNLDDIIAIVDNSYKIKDINLAFAKIFDQPREKFLGEHIKKFVSFFEENPVYPIKDLETIRNYETYFLTKDNKIPVLLSCSILNNNNGADNTMDIIISCKDVTVLKNAEQEKEKLIAELKIALQNIKTLSGLLPICSSCKKIRNDKGYWEQLELYITKHTDTLFSHGLCPDCAKKSREELEKIFGKKS